MITYRHSTFEEVSPVWKEKLWGEAYKFEPTSAMCFRGGYDAEINRKYPPMFLVAEDGGRIVGVLSGHLTSSEHFRARGLFVDPDYRHQSIATTLILMMADEGRRRNARLLWAAPRASSWPIFEGLGFKKESDFTHEGFLFGPNCYVSLALS